MKLIEIIPYIGFDIVKLGMTKQEINNILEVRFNHIKRNYTLDLLDDYYEEGIMIDYNSEEICISAHISNPSKAIYWNHNLLDMTYEKIRHLFPEEKKLYVQENNILFIDTGVAFSFKDVIQKNEKPLLVTVFEKDLFLPYLDEYQKIEEDSV